MTLSRSLIAQAPEALSREWLVTNGIGGFASGTISQANTRRYHGLLIASLKPPVDRVVMVAKADVTIGYRGQQFQLGCNEFADGTIAPQGFLHLSGFRLDDQVPTWTYVCSDAVLEQRIWMVQGRNTTYTSFTLMAASEVVDFELNPLCTYRDYHSHTQGGWSMEVNAETRGCRVTAFPGARPYRLLLDAGEFVANPDWYWRFRHRAEGERGLDETEDLLHPGTFRARLEPGETITFIVTSETEEPESAATASEQDSQRKRSLFQATPDDAPEWTGEVIGPPWLFSLKTVDVLTAGKAIYVFDKSNRKLWESKLAYPVDPGLLRDTSWMEDYDGALSPCVEREPRLLDDTTALGTHEAHRKHLVGLVQDQQRKAAELQGTAVHVIDDAARRPDHHVHSAPQRIQLRLVALTAVDRKYVKAFDVSGIS